MNIPETYAYLVRARRDLWATLEAVPDDVLSRPLLGGERFYCIKDLVFHIADVEDSWIHSTILRDEPVIATFPGVTYAEHGSAFAPVPLAPLLDYWRSVERSTLAYLAPLTDDDMQRVVTDGGRQSRLDGLLWHVMIHEMRHTAQIALLLRLQGITPPPLDLVGYLPRLGAEAAHG